MRLAVQELALELGALIRVMVVGAIPQALAGLGVLAS
jgi:hypothetical protein